MRTRREPPAFRRASIQRVERLTPRLARITLRGKDLVGFAVDEPAASVRLLLPREEGGALEMPTWDGNQYLYEDGTRAILRTLTPRHVDGTRGELVVEVVVHGGVGRASRWAETATPGGEVAISGPARGHVIDTDAARYLIGGDETAIPAICQLLEAMPRATRCDVHIEVPAASARFDLPDHPHATVNWVERARDAEPGDALVHAITRAEVTDDTKVWVAGEAAAVQRIRKHCFETLGLRRTQATIRGYWKHGRTADASDAADAP